MPYVDGRIVHDADSHVFEPPGFYNEWMDSTVREKLRDLLAGRSKPGASKKLDQYLDDVKARQNDPAHRAKDADEVMLRKGFEGQGAFIKEDRPAALDHLGFASQLVFTTSLLGALVISEHTGDVDFAYGLARAHNRGMLDFCSVDRRLLPVAYVPLMDLERAPALAKEAIDEGACALMIASACPEDHGPSHIAFDALWAQAEEAGVPIVLHVGGGVPMNKTYTKNGLPPVPDFSGGDGNFTSLLFMAVPDAPIHTLSALIIDGVLDRFPNLKLGVIEQGASWVPGWMRSLDAAAIAFHKNEERLHKLSMKPSEFVQRQVKVTPYPHENAGWVIEQTGPTVALFSSDYPHSEGGRNPIKRFEESLAGTDERTRDAFYRRNFEELMGDALTRRLEHAGSSSLSA